MDDAELKPCPFCGAEIDDFAGMHPESFARCIERGTFAMGCSRCDTTGPMKPSMEEAIAAWNTRLRSTGELREALIEAREALDDAGDQFWHLSKPEYRDSNPWTKQCFAARDKIDAALASTPAVPEQGDAMG